MQPSGPRRYGDRSASADPGGEPAPAGALGLGTADRYYTAADPISCMSHLVATDGSIEGDDAVRYAAKQAAAFGEPLTIAHVLTPDARVVDGAIVLPGEDEAVEAGENVLESAAALAREAVADADLAVETTLLTGRPADAITDHAADTDADGIYVGHRGLSEERERVVGSVAKSVVDKASVPVTVIR